MQWHISPNMFPWRNKLIFWVNYSINSHPCHSKPIKPQMKIFLNNNFNDFIMIGIEPHWFTFIKQACLCLCLPWSIGICAGQCFYVNKKPKLNVYHIKQSCIYRWRGLNIFWFIYSRFFFFTFWSLKIMTSNGWPEISQLSSKISSFVFWQWTQV